MLNFLRKIRRTEMNGKPARPLGGYFKYAIGEIVLVVVGILIALSINNWNEQRKNRIKEKAILSDIHIEFTKNQEELAYIKSKHEKCLVAAKKLMLMFPIDKNDFNPDSLQITLFSSLGNWSFEPLQGRINWLVNNESFNHILDPQLQEVLLSWESTFRDYNEDEQNALSFNTEQLYPYLMAHFPVIFELHDKRIDLKELEAIEFENIMIGRMVQLNNILHNDSKELQRLEDLIEKIVMLTKPK
jgi:uncharacterized protein DUF6090